ncbi:PilT/PilU family type 4a pilus ATPase [Patescibacteria group bacterium]|nr:PilT/PilU family type 4a pilus ATPase [Patescibacteria group bacterium]
MKNYKQELLNWMSIVVDKGASDLHLSAGRYPIIRILDALVSLTDEYQLSREDVLGFARAMIPEERFENFLSTKEVDFSFEYNSSMRFRGNAFFQKGSVGIALRAISSNIRTIADLNLPKILESFTRKKQGFFLVVGPVGQGKSTTLAAMIDQINHERTEHIMTIEDPLEYLFVENKSIIDQREVCIDTNSFHTALRSLFRQDIDVAMIGEMRDPQTMSTAVTAAETGHLVFSTLHTNDVAQTINRIIDSFPAVQQTQIRLQLAGSLLGIFSQRLIPRISGGRIPAYELLLNNKAVSSLIRESRTHEIDIIIETSAAQGMISMNKSLANLVRACEITPNDAYMHTPDIKALERLL